MSEIQFKLNRFTAEIDAENRTMNKVVIAQAGEAKGHGMSVDDEFLSDIVKYASKKGKNGVKSRLDHHMFNGNGHQLGRMTNIRKEGDKVFGDLKIYESADLSPNKPGMGKWLLSLAKEDPEAVMISISFTRDFFYQKINGQKKKVYYYDEKEGWISPMKGEPIYPKMAELNYCDVVESGAITDSMFQKQEAFFSKLNSDHSMKFNKTLSAIWAFFNFSQETEEAELNGEHLKTLNTHLQKQADEITALKTEQADKDAKIAELSSKVTDKETELSAANTEKEKVATDFAAHVKATEERFEKLENQLLSFQGTPPAQGTDDQGEGGESKKLNYV